MQLDVKRRAQMVAGNEKIDAQNRVEKAEIVEAESKFQKFRAIVAKS